MTITYAELFLIAWATLTTFLAVSRGAELRGLKGFIAKMIADPSVYNALRNKMNGAQT